MLMMLNSYHGNVQWRHHIIDALPTQNTQSITVIKVVSTRLRDCAKPRYAPTVHSGRTVTVLKVGLKICEESTSLFLAFPFLSFLPFSPLLFLPFLPVFLLFPLEIVSLKYIWIVRELSCKLRYANLKRSPTKMKFCVFLALKSNIWCDQFY